MPAPASNPTNAISAVLRKLGLRQRGEDRDVMIEGRSEGGRVVETYVVPLTDRAEEVIAQAAAEITATTSTTGFPFALGQVPGPDDKPVTRLVCRVPVERKKMKPRTTPKNYDVGTGAPSVEDLPEGKVARLINVLGPVWGAAKERARIDDGLSVSHVTEQLLAAYTEGEFQFDANGALIPPRPTTEHARAVLLEALQDYFTGTSTGTDVDPNAIAEALATTLQNAGYARAE
ncbi:hypothetical protein ACFWA9_10160 [Kitasatospora sp. NPDC059973]|uniref:hypothetical protein n=1 Tax=Kitasatospora sp. NPDC059973 TaxID=3347020 RepID=UPI0036AC9356